MKTLADILRTNLAGREVAPLARLLEIYDAEKDVAKCYSAFAYLSCAGAGGSQELAETMAHVIEGFYMATSTHDDALDERDGHVQQHREEASRNSYMILGDCFFVKIASSLARATPLMPPSQREITLARFEQYMFDTAESQIADERSHGRIPSPEEAVAQMKLRGGTWGRLSMQVPALAGGLGEEEAARLGDAGENLFMGLTVRDDLRDLRDDIRNQVLTLAPALFLEKEHDETTLFRRPGNEVQVEALVDLLCSAGTIDTSLARGKAYTKRALAQLRTFLENKDEMHWFLLQMIFRLTNKRIQEFTPEHVRTGKMGIGFSALNEVLDAIEG